MRKEVAVFLTAVIVVSLIGVAISVIGVSTAVLAKDLTKPTSHDYKQGLGRCKFAGCPCTSFSPYTPNPNGGYSEMCKCGHHYDYHY